MEGTLVGYRGLSLCEMKKKIALLKDITKKYNGKFVLFWHNSSFNTDGWLDYKDLYLECIK